MLSSFFTQAQVSNFEEPADTYEGAIESLILLKRWSGSLEENNKTLYMNLYRIRGEVKNKYSIVLATKSINGRLESSMTVEFKNLWTLAQ